MTDKQIIIDVFDVLKQTLTEIKEICNEYQKEYILNIGVEILTNKILQIIEGE